MTLNLPLKLTPGTCIELIQRPINYDEHFVSIKL